MHKLSLLVIFSLFLNAANTQTITAIGEAYEVIMSAPNESKIRNQVVYTTDKFVFASPRMNGDLGIQCLNKEDLAEVWNVVIEENWKYNGIELVPDTVLFLKNGAIVLIGVEYNKKLGKATIYGRIYNVEGEKVETRRITTLVAPNEDDISIHYLVSKSGMLIYSISNLKTESSRIFQAAWIDDKLEEVKKQNTQIEGPQVIENYFYDEPRNALYLCTYPKTNKTFDFTQKDKYVIRFRKEELAPKVEGFLFEDFNAELLNVAADTTTGKPYIFGLAEGKNSNKIANTFIVALNPETLKEEERHFFLISKEVVDRIAETKIFTTIYESSKSVNLELTQVHFTKDDFIVIYENIDINPEYGGLKSHLGQYVLRYSLNFKKVTQIYVPNFGFGNSKSLVDAQGNLRLYFVSIIKLFNKANPTLPIIETTKGLQDMGFFEAKIDASNKIVYQNIFTFKPNNKTVKQQLSLIELANGKMSCFVTASTNWSEFPIYFRALEK